MDILPVESFSKTYLEHSIVIHNFVIKVGSQIKDSLCRVFGDTVQYEWRENDYKVIVHLQGYHVLLWKCYRIPQKNMTVEKKCRYMPRQG